MHNIEVLFHNIFLDLALEDCGFGIGYHKITLSPC